MADISIYQDIAKRTQGNIFLGVVGPVRTGKSTFIKKFMENLVLPNIEGEYEKTRAKDELPQSAQGRTVMTTEPKFIPDEAVTVSLDDNASFKVRMIDCVGFIVPEALGYIENGEPRMVQTPWREELIPFGEAAEMGTKKVITEHSTIGVMVTCDGSFGEIARESYLEAEEKTVAELQKTGKPFVIVLNSAAPENPETVALALNIEEKYGAPVALLNCLELDAEDIRKILELVLLEFPVTEIGIDMPRYLSALPEDHWLTASVHGTVLGLAESVSRIRDIKSVFSHLSENEYIEKSGIREINLGTGEAILEIGLQEDLYYRIIAEETGFDISGEEDLLSTLRELSRAKRKYDKISAALDAVNACGYGIVAPDLGDLKLEEPEIAKQPGGYGVRLRASAPSIHLIRANIETEVNPIVGTEQQSEELLKYLLKEFEEDPQKIWLTNMFGKSLHELVNEGLNAKLAHMPEEARAKLAETLERIINEGSGGLICIIL